MEGGSSEGAKEEGSDWGWWSSVVSSVKATAEKLVEVYKEDLQEFASNISSDTNNAIDEVKKSDLVEKAKAVAQSYETGNLFAQVVEAIVDENASSSSSSSAPQSRLEQKLAELQKDVGTFCTSPSEPEFALFAQTFSAREREKEIVDLLASSSGLSGNYTKLVPVVVSYDDFWMRYLFREHRVREREKERQDLILRASQVVLSPQSPSDLSWDDADWKEQVGDEVNFSQETVNAANRLNFSSNTVLNMIDGAVGSPSLTADDSLLLDGWDNETNETKTVESNETKAIESNVTKATEKASTPLPKQQLEETMTPIAPHSSNKIALDIIEDYAGWE